MIDEGHNMWALGTKNAIAEAAAQELLDHGYAGTSLAKIAKRLGQTKGALTYHFPTKADFATYFIMVLRGATSQADAYAKAHYPECGARRLLLYFLVMDSWQTTEAQLAAGMTLLGDSASPALEADEVIRDWLSISVDALQVCQSVGELDPGLSVLDGAEMFLVTILGAGLFRHHLRSSVPGTKPLRFVRFALAAVGAPTVDEYAHEVVSRYAHHVPTLEYTWLQRFA
ncbi:TetR/AcrR family transcriptional regulator [Enteractinococcus helveticum]|uniref:HTH tetR-type domain-containing protein n=1 Tax=Enteractinococcus helveticum TaxID=1837282 RepID=A0A1B7LVL6_9MICC|nr:TetR/AcrR family transcriptional regulator [Enteractinococcus helveticum]OAV53921.1 hypothetical protein A6F49_00590 [Enteractinococcus helveticum]